MKEGNKIKHSVYGVIPAFVSYLEMIVVKHGCEYESFMESRGQHEDLKALFAAQSQIATVARVAGASIADEGGATIEG
ncbi:hypothetical protein KXD40_008488 [Peronospora effusa]|uniref:Uncharacterized protein n=1 Tax=Peronospora effusa TaxID=542832 RepID=A0A3M6V957_9STRA|nr:hypothetical protein DD238_007162 [Peronospora effusa]UIZ24561.1 hypothetical protein KXD40_008488 [Peronospora effusa]